jgi:hypothetical protein
MIAGVLFVLLGEAVVDDYVADKQNVPRWIPRSRPWTPDEEVRPS